VALVGESGSGKSVTALSVLKLLPYPAASIPPVGPVQGPGSALGAEPEMRRVRGNDITMIFQEPMTSLNPLQTVERRSARSCNCIRDEAMKPHQVRTLELLDQVGIRDAGKRLASYPAPAFRRAAPAGDDRHGACQQPELLIADEPTTALDVTVQAQILELLLGS
jgi:microcin C transport system ATP-binding protein